MTKKETNEMTRLSRRWACGSATTAEILRCMALDRKSEAEARARRATETPQAIA